MAALPLGRLSWIIAGVLVAGTYYVSVDSYGSGDYGAYRLRYVHSNCGQGNVYAIGNSGSSYTGALCDAVQRRSALQLLLDAQCAQAGGWDQRG